MFRDIYYRQKYHLQYYQSTPHIMETQPFQGEAIHDALIEAEEIDAHIAFVGSKKDKELYEKQKAAEDAERALREKALKENEEYNSQ